MHKVTTLVLVRKDKQILLGMKKRGFGEGRWNGFGGKVQPGESIIEAAKRELREESGLIANQLTPCAHLSFDFETVPDTIECTVFFVDSWSGDLIETAEMRPQWFPTDSLPYEAMWTGDKYWIPAVLKGKNIQATFHFKDFVELGEYTITEV